MVECPAVELRPVEPGDLDSYVRLRTDPWMMAELGGPQDAATLPDKVARDVAAVAADRAWIFMILPNVGAAAVAGTVTLWSPSDESGNAAAGESEIGWMVLPEFQGRGLATAAVVQLLRRAERHGRWGLVHAYPSVTNDASNRLCRRAGFALLGPRDTLFRGRVFRTNDWAFDAGPRASGR